MSGYNFKAYLHGHHRIVKVTQLIWEDIELKMIHFEPFEIKLPKKIAKVDTAVNFTIMQFAGIYDKYGTPVYEGDIITIDSTEIGGSIRYGEVQFNTDQLLSRLEYGLWNDKQGYIPTDFLGEITIEGNVYEQD